MLAALVAEGLQEPAVEGEHHEHAELGEGLGVHARGGGEDDVAHRAVIPMRAHVFADAGAGGLDPPEVGRQRRQLESVHAIEVEQDVRPRQQIPPLALLSRCAREWPAVMVGRVSRRRQQIRDVQHLQPSVDGPNPFDVLRFEIAGDQDDVALHLPPPRLPDRDDGNYTRPCPGAWHAGRGQPALSRRAFPGHFSTSPAVRRDSSWPTNRHPGPRRAVAAVHRATLARSCEW